MKVKPKVTFRATVLLASPSQRTTSVPQRTASVPLRTASPSQRTATGPKIEFHAAGLLQYLSLGFHLHFKCHNYQGCGISC